MSGPAPAQACDVVADAGGLLGKRHVVGVEHAVEGAGLVRPGGGEQGLEVGHGRTGGAEDLHGASGPGGDGGALQEDLGDVVAVDAGPAGDEVALTQVERRSPGPW